jgi:hypothetical protein
MKPEEDHMNLEKRLVAVHFVLVSCLVSFGYADQASDSRPRFSLKLGGGGMYCRMGDINSHMESISTRLTLGTSQGLSTKNIPLLSNWIGTWEVEGRIVIWKKLGLGISITNPRHSSQDTNLPLVSIFDSQGAIIGAFSSTQKVDLRTTLRGSLYYSHPVLAHLDLLVNGGIGLYEGRMSEAFDYDINDTSGAAWYRTSWATEWKRALGYHVGVGAEYMLNSHFALAADFKYQHVHMSDFSATMNSESNLWPSGFYYDSNGDLYAWGWGEDGPLGMGYGELIVWQGTPPTTGGTMGSYARGKAFLDLSGFSFMIGIKIGLF